MPELAFYNTLQRSVEPFRPQEGNRVRLYCCGPTVYHHAHIGNLRTFLFEDLLRRTLRYLGYDVTLVMNITDVDDKTIQRAREQGVELDDYTAPYIESFYRDIDLLHIERAEHYPRATQHITEMIRLIERLMEKEIAYETGGSIFYRISGNPNYGRLSGMDLDQMQQGERVADDEYEKKDVRDFVLWKGAKEGEPAWDSPWGPGRPGWHIECSAMSMRYLGESFDIHCGGVDNIFPHHENEIAQSESATDKPFAKYWLHAEHLIVDGKKMSKSLGNQYTLEELIHKGAQPRAIRYLMLSVHYRQKFNFTFDALEQAANRLRRLDEMRQRLQQSKEMRTPNPDVARAVEKLEVDFGAALADDLNISNALAALSTFVKQGNVTLEEGRLGTGDREVVLQALQSVDRVLGTLDPEEWDPPEVRMEVDKENIKALIGKREQARSDRDFSAADRIRDQLLEQGVVLEDTPQGTRWKRG